MAHTNRSSSTLLPVTIVVGLLAFLLAPSSVATSQVAAPAVPAPPGHPDMLFLTSHECLACHNGITTAAGEDVSIGTWWRGSIMANSSRDPYWQAAVRRETIDHPLAAEAIEDECSICHMPMVTAKARAAGQHGKLFAHLPGKARPSADDRLGADGVSCTLCHQIGPERFGTRESFTGGFVISRPAAGGGRRMFGPYGVEAGRAAVMRSATGMTPAEGMHVRESELCATCHTLYTHALGPDGKAIGELPEQVPYLEWRHSAFREERSCQSCHMPAVEGRARMSSVLGVEREGLGRHTFLGGNFFVLRMLNRYRAGLGVEALPQELDAAAHATIAQLQQDTATVSIVRADGSGDRLVLEIGVRNLTGHKLPTAYPSRRAWLHLTVRDARDGIVFSSGGVTPSGLIRGNDNDADAARFEPHYTEIRSEDQVQIYESVMRDAGGLVTTGLLHATGYLKDNRLLPRGFDKGTAIPDIAVHGAALEDPDFTAERDHVRYVVDTSGRTRPFRVDVALRYQPIGFRWAQNLKPYEAGETRRFGSWYDAMSTGSSVVLARSSASVP